MINILTDNNFIYIRYLSNGEVYQQVRLPKSEYKDLYFEMQKLEAEMREEKNETYKEKN